MSETSCFSQTHTGHITWLICEYFLTWLQHHITITILNVTVIVSCGNAAVSLPFFTWCIILHTQLLATNGIFIGTDVVIDTWWTMCQRPISGQTCSRIALCHAHAECQHTVCAAVGRVTLTAGSSTRRSSRRVQAKLELYGQKKKQKQKMKKQNKIKTSMVYCTIQDNVII